MKILPLLFVFRTCSIRPQLDTTIRDSIINRIGTTSSAVTGEFVRSNGSDVSENTSLALQTSVEQFDEEKAIVYIVTTMEPVTVGVLLGIAALGSLFNTAITQARLSEARRTVAALQSASQKLLSERTSVCLATRALSFQSMLLSVQTEVFLKAASHALAQANLMEDRADWPATDVDTSGAAKEPPTKAEVEAAREDMLVRHAALIKQHARNREESVQALCAQRVDPVVRTMKGQVKVAKDVSDLRDKLMNDWVSVLFGSFFYALFDPTFKAALGALPEAASAVAGGAVGGAIEGTLDFFEDSTLQELSKMVGGGKAPLWVLRALNAISHFLDSGILKTQAHVEVIVYAIRAGVITTHGLIKGNLRTAFTTKDPAQRMREFFNVVENSFFLIRDVYRIIYGAGQVVPWSIVGVFAIFQNLKVAFEIGTNWQGFHKQVVQHRQTIRMSDMDAWKQQLAYRFSACVSFARTESLASEQFDFLSAFQNMLQALPSASSQQGAVSFSIPDLFAVGQYSLHHTIQDILDESPQFCYQALLAPRSKSEEASAEREALGILLHEMSESQLSEVHQAALWGPITDLAVSENAQQDAAYAAMGFFEPVLGWRLWACRGCSKHRILHAVVCHGTEIADCLQRNEALVHEELSALGEIAVQVIELPIPEQGVVGGFSQIYRQPGVQPRLLFVTALLQDVKPNTPVLKSLEWGRLAYSVYGRLHDPPAYEGPGNSLNFTYVDSHNSLVDAQEAEGSRVIARVQQLVQELTDEHSKNGLRVRALWDGHSRLNEWSTDKWTGQLSEYTGPTLKAVLTGSPTTQFAFDFASATFQSEKHMMGKAPTFTKVLITVGFSCHWAAALRLHRGVQRIRTPSYFRDVRKDLNHAMVEGWLLEEEAWHGQVGEKACSGYQRILQHLPVGCHPLSVVDLCLQPLSPPEAPGDMCKKNETRALSIPSLVEEAVMCTGQSCSPQKVDIKHWELAGEWEAFRSTEEPLMFELWVRRSQIEASLASVHVDEPAVFKQNLPAWIGQTRVQLQQFRRVLADALCSEQQCHFRSGPKSLPQLLGLPSGAAEIPSYLHGWLLDQAEVLEFGRGGQEGTHKFAGMPQVAFARRRRHSDCAAVTQYLRDWANQHPSAASLVDVQTLGDKVLAVGTENMSVRGPNSVVLKALGEVHRAGALLDCAILNGSERGVDSLMDVLLTAAAAHAKSAGECGFELLVPIQPQVLCRESDGLGLQLSISPDATITEHCAELDKQPTVDSYLLWFSLRAKGADELGVNARRTAREIQHALRATWGYSTHMPLSQQAQGCVVPVLEAHTDEAKARRLVFRQEVWTRLDPRLSGQGLQISQHQMCELKDSLQDYAVAHSSGTDAHEAELLYFRDELMSKMSAL